MKKSQKILIEEILKKLREGNFLGSDEDFYNLKTIEVTTGKKIVFELHRELGQLLEKEYSLGKYGRNKLSFNKSGQMIIEAGGLESHFLASLLESGYERLKKERKGLTALKREMIENELEKIMSGLDPDKKYTTLVQRKNGKYRVSVQKNGESNLRLTFESESVECLNSEMSERLPGLIRAIA